MKEAFELVLSTFKKVYPSGLYFWFTLAALLYLLILRRKRSGPKLLAIYSAVVMAAFFFPPVARIMVPFMRDGFVYWRFLWIFPSAVLISFAGVSAASFSSKRIVNAAASIAVIAVLVLGGKNLYADGAFKKPLSREKLPDITLITAAAIEENIRSTGNTYAHLAAPLLVSSEIREVTSAVTLFSGRVIDILSLKETNKGWYRNLMVLNNQLEDAKHKTIKSLKRQRCNYILIYDAAGVNGDLEKRGYSVLHDGGNWKLWFNPEVEPKKEA